MSRVGVRGATLPGMSARALRLLGPRLQRQHGVFTVAQAAQDGVDRRTLRRLRQSKLLVPVQMHVLRCALAPYTWRSAAMGAQLAAGPAAALGRWSAARMLGLVRDGSRPTELDLIQPSGRNLRDVVPKPRRSGSLRQADVVEVDGFRCTSVAWTLADLVAVTPPGVVERIAARAVAERRVTQDGLTEVADRWRHRAGAPAVRRLLGATDQVVVGSRSRPESGFARAMAAAGLPLPLVNHPVTDAAGCRRELDAAWPEWALAAEIDVHPGHATTIGRRLDGRRQNDLVAVWTILRFDEHDLTTRLPEVVRQVRAALVRAGWRGAD
jgi:hypothetical protein